MTYANTIQPSSAAGQSLVDVLPIVILARAIQASLGRTTGGLRGPLQPSAS